ncbi:ABC transporter family substrate-binding protein [Corynebacterium sp. P7003]|uniref:ABC transporter family substrate-binding protein n=1 Tax=Corynebacterium pygosceleis TaxID=2800406 RepID=A0ABT3WP36_9CORY|nr:ABC transporter family substrate-binding protein [Corynebacterium pygosceleis]MCX7444032.1 ABC transporter family substrate-binding protein [Corynebacterium pygosceleis]
MKPNKFVLQLTAALAAGALALSGCSGDSGSSGSSSAGGGSSSNTDTVEVAASDFAPTERDDIKDGGELVTAIYEIPEQQNRFHADASAPVVTIWNWYNPQIALFDGEGNYTANPSYISEVTDEVVDGNTVVTFTVVDDAKWNDGSDIDWTAFETTWRINNGESDDYTPSATDGYERITSVEEGDSPKQAVITFDGVYPWWEGLFNQIAHPALADPANYNSYLKEVHPEWGAGPYTVENIDFNKGEAVFVRNDKWWGPEGKLDRRIFRQMESQAAINAFKNGEIDVVGASSRESYATVENMDGIDLRMATRPSSALITLNSEAGALGDIKVREAVARGLDRQLLGQIRFNGTPYSETPPGSLIIYPFQEDYHDNFSAAADFDPEAAKALLDEAGWAEGSSGIREKDGETLHLTYTLIGDNETSKAQATATQKMMKDIGIDLEIRQRPSSEFSDVYTNRDFEIFPMGFSSSDPYGVAYFGQTYNSDSQLNLSGTGTPELDEQIRELQALPTTKEQIKRANELETEAFKRYGLIPTGNGADIYAVKDGLVNSGALGFAVLPVENIGWKKD